MFAKRRQITHFQRILLALFAGITLVQVAVQPAVAVATNHPPVSTLAAEDIYEKTLAGTVFIVTYDAEGKSWFGTGWITNAESGLLITNHHVIAGASRIDIYFPEFKDGELLTDLSDYRFVTPQEATVVDSDMTFDLAMLKVDQVSEESHELELAARSARPGSTVHSIGGKPVGSTGLFSYATGSVRQIQNSGLNTYGNQIRTIETNLSSNPGNSGGPMVNDQGQVVGVVSNGSTDDEVINAVVAGVDVVMLRDYIEKVTDLLKMDTGAKCNELGRRHTMEGRYRVAIDCFSKAISLEPENSTHLEDQAMAFFMLNDLETALVNATEAIQLNSRSATGFAMRAMIYGVQNKHADALADWTRSISIEPNGFRYGERARALVALKQDSRAVSDLDRAIALEPTETSHRIQRTIANVKLNQVDKARQDLKAVIEMDTLNHHRFNELGITLFNEKKFELAFEAFAAASRINKQQAQYPVNAGIALRNFGNNKLAIEWYDWALKIDPNHPAAKEGRQLAIAAVGQSTGKTQVQTSGRVNKHPLSGTWSLNIDQNSKYLHAHIRLEPNGAYSGIIQMLNDDRTVNEEAITGTWNAQGNQLTITTDKGAATTYDVSLSGDNLNVYQEGKLLFTYRKIK